MTNNSEKLTEELIDFVLRESGIPNYKLNPNTCLIHDLGVVGDDGIEFMIAYSKKFNVDLSGFMADKYFEAEGLQFFNGFLEKLGLRENKLKHLYVKDLQKGIAIGYLNDEVIQS